MADTLSIYSGFGFCCDPSLCVTGDHGKDLKSFLFVLREVGVEFRSAIPEEPL